MVSDGFADLARSLSAFVDAGERRTPQPFGADSEAARECTGEPMADDWGKAPNHEAWFMAGLSSGAGWDHLRALAELLRGGLVTQSLSTVARGAMEAFAVAYYIGDPDIDSRERVRRYMNLRLQSLFDQGLLLEVTATGEMTDTEREQQREAEEDQQNQSRQIISSAPHHEFRVYDERDNRRATHLGPKVPSKTALCEAAVASDTSRLGTVFYKSLSATAHSTIHGFARGLVLDPASGDYGAQFGMDAKNAATHLVGGVLAAITVLSAVNPYRGWPTPQDAIDAVGFTWMGVGEVEVPDEVVIPEAFRRPGWGH